MNPFLALAHQQIKSLQPYAAGQSMQSLKNIGKDNIIKLASNENPLGASPAVQQAILQSIEQLHLYPENMDNTRLKIAQHLNIEPSQCILGCGSENIIAMLCQVFNRKESHYLIPQYAFSAYKLNAQAHNANIKLIPTPNFCLDVASILAMTTPQTAMIFIDNPNNPLGYYLNHQQIESLLQQLPSATLLVLDEAYYEYASQQLDYPDSLSLQKKYPNLVILRTFSKAYGLAGARVGYGIGHSQLIELLNRVRFPFNVSALSLAAATAALDDQDFVKKSIQNNQLGLIAFKKCFARLNLSFLPSVSNFITVNLKQNSSNLFNYMLEQGIILRPLTTYQLPNHIRISIGTEVENTKAINAITKYFGDHDV